MDEDLKLKVEVLEAFDQIEYTPYSAWCQYFFSHGGSEAHEGLAFCAPRVEVMRVQQFVAASVFRMLNFFGHSRNEVRALLETAIVQPAEGAVENCDAWRGLADTRRLGSVDMLASFQAAYPDLKLVCEIFELENSIGAFAVALNEKSFVAFYWYTTG